jgi:hypothetical protein
MLMCVPLRVLPLFRICLIAAVLFVFAQSLPAQNPPVIGSITPSEGVEGSTIRITLEGAGFVEGSTELQFTGSGVVVNGVWVTDASTLQALVILTGEAGTRTVSCVVAGQQTNPVSFQIDPSPLSDAALVVSSIAGIVGGNGTRDARGAEARFFTPGALWADSNFVFVSDDGNGTVRRISRATGDVTTIAGTPGQPTGPERLHKFSAAWGDGTYLYVISGYGIFRLTIATNEVVLFAGAVSSSGLVDGIGGQALFQGPHALWGNGEFLYVLDSGVYHIGGGAVGNPITQTAEGAIREVSLRTQEVHTIPLPEIQPGATFQPDPLGIWGQAGFLYLAYRSASGIAIGRFEIATRKFETLFGFPVAGSFWSDGQGSFYFLSLARNLLRKISLPGGQVIDFPITIPGVAPMPTVLGLSGNGDELFMSDATDNVIVKFQISTGKVQVVAGTPPTPIVSSGTQLPPLFGGSPIWGDGEFIYAIRGQAIYRVSLATGVVAPVAGSYDQRGNTDGIGLNARFSDPSGLWGDGRYLYVSDANASNRDIRRIDLATADVIHFAGNDTPLPDGVRKRAVDGVGAAASFLVPEQLWGDGKYLYVTDLIAIRRINLATQEVTTFAGDQLVFEVKDGTGTSAHFQVVSCLWGDGTNLYVCDLQAFRKISIKSAAVSTISSTPVHRIWGAGGAAAFSLLGYGISAIDLTTGAARLIAGGGPGTEDGPALDARFYNPSSVWSNGDAIYVSDKAIRKIEPAKPASFTVSSAASWMIAGQSAISMGYVRLQSNAGISSMAGTAILSLRQNGVLISETAVPGSPLTQSARIYAEVNGTQMTGIAIANPNDDLASVSFYFTDADGSNFNAGTITIPANAQVAAFLNQDPFSGAAAVERPLTDARTFTMASSLPVAAVALQGFVNERSELLMTTLPVTSLDSSAQSKPSLIPHVAVGGGWSTSILLVNPSDNAIGGTFQFVAPNGHPDAATNYRIAPRSSSRLDVPSSSAEIRTGSILVVPDQGQITPIASTVFSFVRDGVTVTQNGLIPPPTSHAVRIFAEAWGDFGQVESIRTGIAIANAGVSNAIVNLELTDMNGNRAGIPISVTIPAAGQTAFFLHESSLFTGVTLPFQGSVRVSTVSTAGLSVIGLRCLYNERGDFLIATMPVLDEESSTPSGEIFFPHILNGGGFTTEIVLVARNKTDGTVSFFSQSSQQLPFVIP